MWTHFSDREAKVLKSVTQNFEKLHPGVTVELHEGQQDDKMAKVIASGSSKIDIINSSGTDNLGAFCGSGSVRDLGPYITRDKVDLSKILEVPRTYTAFDGKQCSLPMMTDSYGLYYNKDLLDAAGITAPPKTLSELETDALALTTYKTDGSIKTLGFNPLIGFYENQAAQWTFFTGASWMKDGKSTIAQDPAWKELMTWQKGLIDKISYD
ncbi:MAG: extracellular solute-binding protein, partial [Lacisediminihabitans sp.]